MTVRQASMVLLMLLVLAGASSVTAQREEASLVAIEDTGMKRPLILVPDAPGPAGSIWYRTEEGNFFLTGPPDGMARRDGGVFADWKMVEGRTVSLRLVQVDHHHDLHLVASPSDGIIGWGLVFPAFEEESFRGLRSDADGQLELAGKGLALTTDLRNRKILFPNGQNSSPAFLSSAGYGLCFHAPGPGVYDFCASRQDQVSVFHHGPSLAARITTGTQEEIAQHLAQCSRDVD